MLDGIMTSVFKLRIYLCQISLPLEIFSLTKIGAVVVDIMSLDEEDPPKMSEPDVES